MTEVVGKGVRNAFIAFALIVSLFILGEDWMSRDTDPDAVRLQSGNTVLFDHRHECWTSGPAMVEVPTHVIMRIEDGIGDGQWRYLGKRYVDIALADTFTKDNPRVYVVAFCK